MNTIKYSLVQFTPDRKRNETINIGLLVFLPRRFLFIYVSLSGKLEPSMGLHRRMI